MNLIDDMARFGVMVKVPFLNMGDAHVKTSLLLRGWGWYNREAQLKMRQAAGRIIRHPDDWGSFYLADRGSRRFRPGEHFSHPKLGIDPGKQWVAMDDWVINAIPSSKHR